MLDERDRDALAYASAQIKRLMKSTLPLSIEVGSSLSEIEQRFYDREVEKWIEDQFGINREVAQLPIILYRRFFGNELTVASLKASVICKLANPSTPQHVVDEAIRLALSGRDITLEDIIAIEDSVEAQRG